MAFKIFYDPECLKRDLPKLNKPILLRIKKTIETRLVENPSEFGKPLRYTAKGLWSLRVGDYRIIYKIMEDKVWILRLGHRREVYSIF